MHVPYMKYYEKKWNGIQDKLNTEVYKGLLNAWESKLQLTFQALALRQRKITKLLL